jgi:hypothetical protein
VLLLRSARRLPIAGNPRHRTANSTLHAIRNPLPQITQLPLCLLRLAFRILLLTLLLQALIPDESTDRFFGAADGLVPAALLTVRVVGCNARGADADTADAGACFAQLVARCCFGFLVFGCLLVGWVTGDGADGGLD